MTRHSRREALRLWAALVGLGAIAARPTLARAAPSRQPSPDLDSVVSSESAQLATRYSAESGRYSLTQLSAFGFDWAVFDSPALWLEGVRVEGEAAANLDGATGWALDGQEPAGLRLRHDQSGLVVSLECEAQPGNAFVHRLELSNARESGAIAIERTATLAWRLTAGERASALGTDGTLENWRDISQPLPVEFGNHELRGAERGVYPLVRLERGDGSGLIVAVSTSTAWRIALDRAGDQRVLRAGEYSTLLSLGPGERARLPDVTTIFYQDGPAGAVAALRRHLSAVSLPPPTGWTSTAPPVLFNTWFAYQSSVGDDGSERSLLRYAARVAASVGVEVFVLDAGWYLGNPYLLGSGVERTEPPAPDVPANEAAAPTLAAQSPADDFGAGLGTWLENPAKWLARPGDGGSPHAGLRNFSDYVHSLDVSGPDGRSQGKMRFGLWFEPERFDPHLERPERVPASWAIPTTPVLDFSRSEVVDGITARIQRAIDLYRVDYVKLDANLAVGPAPALGRAGHFFTRWSQGYEQLYRNLRQANPGLYLEQCASGLRRYWIGLAGLAHTSWLDDDVEVDNVERLLNATDQLMLPRQKTVLVTEDLSRYRGDGDDGDQAEQAAVIQAYWGGARKNGGSIGFSSRIEHWGEDERSAARTALAFWKRDVRPELR